MDFDQTEEQQAVRDLAARVLGDRATPERLRGLDASGEWFDAELWRDLAGAGLLGIALPADVGGQGLSFLELHLLLEQAGATAAYVPLWETLVLGALPVAAFGTQEQRRRLLPPVVAGTCLLTAALVDDGPADAREPATTAQADGTGWRLTGTKTRVPIAQLADRVLVSARTEVGPVLALVAPDARGVALRPQETMSGIPHAQVVLDAVAVPAEDVLAGPDEGEAALAWLLDRAVAGLASLQAGICAAALRLTATHAASREQFGRPIATFQAVGQRLADAYIDAEAVQLTALQAAWRLAADLPARAEVAIAKWWAAEGGHRVLHAAHHVHGGIGMDREYPLHRYFLRTREIELTLGGATTHLLALGAALAAEAV